MMPDDVLSTTVQQGPFVGARRFPVTLEIDYEDGGVAINDPSEGSNFQTWKGELIEDVVTITGQSNGETATIYTGTDITEISFTFDQNMRPVLAFVEGGVSKMQWFDSVAGMQVVTTFSGATTPRVCLDDKRHTQTSNSDVILAYVKTGNLYFRQQRDRFLTEYLLTTGIESGLIKIGMNINLRLQFMFEVVN